MGSEWGFSLLLFLTGSKCCYGVSFILFIIHVIELELSMSLKEGKVIQVSGSAMILLLEKFHEQN